MLPSLQQYYTYSFQELLLHDAPHNSYTNIYTKSDLPRKNYPGRSRKSFMAEGDSSKVLLPPYPKLLLVLMSSMIFCMAFRWSQKTHFSHYLIDGSVSYEPMATPLESSNIQGSMEDVFTQCCAFSRHLGGKQKATAPFFC